MSPGVLLGLWGLLAIFWGLVASPGVFSRVLGSSGVSWRLLAYPGMFLCSGVSRRVLACPGAFWRRLACLGVSWRRLACPVVVSGRGLFSEHPDTMAFFTHIMVAISARWNIPLCTNKNNEPVIFLDFVETTHLAYFAY